MEVKDLMIGDWVNIAVEEHNNPTRIREIDSFCVKVIKDEMEYGSILVTPIPLTKEILEKNGWEKRPTGYVFYTDGKRYDNSLWYILGSNTFVVNTVEFQIKYVHELQHALKLCGITKEIEL